MKKRKEVVTPRNPYVQHLVNRDRVHVKSKKAERQREKAKLKKSEFGLFLYLAQWVGYIK